MCETNAEGTMRHDAGESGIRGRMRGIGARKVEVALDELEVRGNGPEEFVCRCIG